MEKARGHCFLGDTGLAAPHRTSLAVREGAGHLDTAGHLEILKRICAKPLSLCRLTWSWVLGEWHILPTILSVCGLNTSRKNQLEPQTVQPASTGVPVFPHSTFLPFKPSGFPAKNCAQLHGSTPWILNCKFIIAPPPPKNDVKSKTAQRTISLSKTLVCEKLKY